jgi:hypothetical protein
MYPTLFSIQLHHGGSFSGSEGQQYQNGQVSSVDLLDTEAFSMTKLEEVRLKLGFAEVECYYYFVGEHDLGSKPLRDENDVSRMLELLPANRIIHVYAEHRNSDLDPITDIEVALDDAVVTSNCEQETSEGSDSDFNVDAENDIHDVHVDMMDYKLNVDLDDEVLDNDAFDSQDNVHIDDEVLDNDEFDSGCESDDNIGSIRKAKLKQIRRDSDRCFHVGQLFGSKIEVKNLIRTHSVETRRCLKIIKDEKNRIRVICAGSLPNFEFNEDGVLQESQQRVENVVAALNEGLKGKNKGGRGKKANPEKYLCPWTLLVSLDKASSSWMVKTYLEEHKCTQSRQIKACTSSFLSGHLMEQIEENPNIPVKAVQEQFQRKFEVSISQMKAFRAKRKALSQLHGDYTTQYELLRDYVDEILRTNPGSTVKIEVEPSTDPGSQKRKFKRIYICLGSLKQGFRAIGRELLGLDGAFMKGPYPGQVLTAVGIDNNNGIYPLSYAIVEAENINSWTWFLKCVGDDLDLSTNSNFTFVSDRQKVYFNYLKFQLIIEICISHLMFDYFRESFKQFQPYFLVLSIDSASDISMKT